MCRLAGAWKWTSDLNRKRVRAGITVQQLKWLLAVLPPNSEVHVEGLAVPLC